MEVNDASSFERGLANSQIADS